MQHYIVTHETRYGNVSYVVKADEETAYKEDFESKVIEALGLDFEGEDAGDYLNWDVLNLSDIITIK